MNSSLGVQLILCDHAVTDPTGKTHMLGAGWTQTSSPTAPHGVAVLIQVPWDRANERMRLTLQLLTLPGGFTGPPSEPGGPPTRFEVTAELEVGRPPGTREGSYLPAAFAINVGSLNLAPGTYKWRLDIAEAECEAIFEVTTRPLQ